MKNVNWGPVAQWVLAGVAVATFLDVKKYIEFGTITTWIATVATGIVIGFILIVIDKVIERINVRVPGPDRKTFGKESLSKWASALTKIAIAMGAMVLLYKLLLVTTHISEFVNNETRKIAQRTREGIFNDAREDHEKVITTLGDSEAVREVIYRNALDQAEKKGYIFSVAGQYSTNYLWREGNRLLTERQRKSIEKCFSTKPPEEDLYSLMYAALSNEDVIKALESDATLVRLTQYDLIGVLGGYLGELKLEIYQVKKQGSETGDSKKYYPAPPCFLGVYDNRTTHSEHWGEKGSAKSESVRCKSGIPTTRYQSFSFIANDKVAIKVCK